MRTNNVTTCHEGCLQPLGFIRSFSMHHRERSCWRVLMIGQQQGTSCQPAISECLHTTMVNLHIQRQYEGHTAIGKAVIPISQDRTRFRISPLQVGLVRTGVNYHAKPSSPLSIAVCDPLLRGCWLYRSCYVESTSRISRPSNL